MKLPEQYPVRDVYFHGYHSGKTHTIDPTYLIEGETYCGRFKIGDMASSKQAYARDTLMNVRKIQEKWKRFRQSSHFKVSFSPVNDKGDVLPEQVKKRVQADGSIVRRSIILPLRFIEIGYFVGSDPPNGDSSNVTPNPIVLDPR